MANNTLVAPEKFARYSIIYVAVFIVILIFAWRSKYRTVVLAIFAIATVGLVLRFWGEISSQIASTANILTSATTAKKVAVNQPAANKLAVRNANPNVNGSVAQQTILDGGNPMVP